MYKLLYYTQYDGAWTISDTSMKRIWERMIEERAERKLFYSKDIINAEMFTMYFKSPRTFPFFIFKGDRFDADAVDAFVWCTNIKGKCGMIHFCVFKKSYGKGRELSDAVFNYIFRLKDANGNTVITSLRGETPKFNTMAVRFLRTVGMTILGEIPDMAYDKYSDTLSPMVISYISSEKFNRGIENE